MSTPTLLGRLKCDLKNENNRRNSSALSSSQHFGGKKGMLKLQDGN